MQYRYVYIVEWLACSKFEHWAKACVKQVILPLSRWYFDEFYHIECLIKVLIINKAIMYPRKFMNIIAELFEMLLEKDFSESHNLLQL